MTQTTIPLSARHRRKNVQFTPFQQSSRSKLSKAKKIKNILLIDDSESTLLKHQEIVKTVLPSTKVFSFKSADQAISHLAKPDEPRPEMIFLDIVMPEKDGFQFMDEYLNRFTTHTHQNSPLVLLVSEYLSLPNFELSQGYKMLGLNIDHIKKPLLSSDLKDLIEEHY